MSTTLKIKTMENVIKLLEDSIKEQLKKKEFYLKEKLKSDDARFQLSTRKKIRSIEVFIFDLKKAIEKLNN